tara:strand:+ start:618 stop:914 length:297 start_codon:yes stop_codon:yes gene_type:complete
MNYKIVRDKHICGKRYVWYNNFCLGYFLVSIIENKNIDWPKYKADKTLRIDPKERWYAKYRPTAYPNLRCETVFSEEDAVRLIVAKHHKEFEKYNFEE